MTLILRNIFLVSAIIAKTAYRHHSDEDPLLNLTPQTNTGLFSELGIAPCFLFRGWVIITLQIIIYFLQVIDEQLLNFDLILCSKNWK